MAVGTGSIKRASNAAKEKEAKDSAKTSAEEVKSGTEPDKKPDVKAADKTPAKKSTAKKTSSSKKTTASKTSVKKSDSEVKKTDDKKENDKHYEIIEGITCNMPRYLL